MTRAQSPGGQVRFIAVNDAELGQVAALGAIRIGVGAQAAAAVFPAALATVEAQNGVEAVRPLQVICGHPDAVAAGAGQRRAGADQDL